MLPFAASYADPGTCTGRSAWLCSAPGGGNVGTQGTAAAMLSSVQTWLVGSTALCEAQAPGDRTGIRWPGPVIGCMQACSLDHDATIGPLAWVMSRAILLAFACAPVCSVTRMQTYIMQQEMSGRIFRGQLTQRFLPARRVWSGQGELLVPSRCRAAHASPPACPAGGATAGTQHCRLPGGKRSDGVAAGPAQRPQVIA